MTLSIIIINYKNPALLRLCLKSLERVLGDNKDYETLVVDVESELATENVVEEEFPSVKLLPFRSNIGYTKAVNEGIENSLGEFILILNPDIVPLQGSIEKMLEYMRNHPQSGMIGPRLLNFDGSNQHSCFRFYTPLTVIYRRSFLGKLPFAKKTLDRFLMKDENLDETVEADWIMGSAMMVSRQATKKVGVLDEELFLYMSDVDWAKRFWENGYKVIYLPKARMYHYHRRGSRGGILDLLFKKESRWHLKDAVKYFLKK